MLTLHIAKTKNGVLISENEFKQIISLARKLKTIEIETNDFQDLIQASSTSMNFWENEIDDEVWNDA